jgi:hypothetical protein
MPSILQGNYAINQMRSLCRPVIHAFGENSLTPLPYSYSRYIFDVYINGVMVLREYKAITLGTTIFSYLDVAPIIKNYIQANISSMYLPYIQYDVKYGVEDATTGVITTNIVTETSYAWYGYPSFLNDDLRADIGTYNDRLYVSTNRSRNIQIYGNYTSYVPIYKSAIYHGGLIDYVYLGAKTFLYDSGDNGIYNIPITQGIFDWVGVAPEDQYLYFEVDGDQIDNMPDSRILFEYPCTKNNPVMLHFLNSLGGFESFLFSGVNRVNTNIERQSINKLGLITTYTSSGLDRGVSLDRVYNSTLGEVKTNYSNTMTHKMKLVSEYVSETDFLWLREMLASPQVFAQIDNNAIMIPVTIETSDWAEKKRGADKIFNLEIDILLGTQSTQLR